MSLILALLDKIVGPTRDDMHCPICEAVNIISGPYYQFQCWKCRNWAHVDNWTYTKEAQKMRKMS